MKIKLTSVYVDDQEGSALLHPKCWALPRDRFQQWAVSLADCNLTRRAGRNELQLALNDKPAAKTYQQSDVSAGPARGMFFTDDVKGDYGAHQGARRRVHHAPTEVTGLDHRQLNDTCGNLIQITSWRAGKRAFSRRSFRWIGTSGFGRSIVAVHRFYGAVIINIVAMVREEQAVWVGLLALLRSSCSCSTGLYLFVLPYVVKWRSARGASGRSEH